MTKWVYVLIFCTSVQYGATCTTPAAYTSKVACEFVLARQKTVADNVSSNQVPSNGKCLKVREDVE